MAARILRNPAELAEWVAFLQGQALPITVSSVKGARRSNPQNSTAAKWYAQIAAETGEEPGEVKAQCKWRHGKPIMESERPDWVAKWEPMYSPMPYRTQIKLFEIIPLTRLLTTRQMARFMDAVQRDYRAQGFALIDPEARKYEEWAQ